MYHFQVQFRRFEALADTLLLRHAFSMDGAWDFWQPWDVVAVGGNALAAFGAGLCAAWFVVAGATATTHHPDRSNSVGCR